MDAGGGDRFANLRRVRLFLPKKLAMNDTFSLSSCFGVGLFVAWSGGAIVG